MASHCKKVVLGFHRAAFNRTRPIAQPHKTPMAPLRFHYFTEASEAPKVHINKPISSKSDKPVFLPPLNPYVSAASELFVGVGGFLALTSFGFNGGVVIKYSESTVDATMKSVEVTMKSVEATMKSVKDTMKSVEATMKSMEKGK